VDMKQVWAMSAGFFLVFIMISVTNRPHVSTKDDNHRSRRGHEVTFEPGDTAAQRRSRPDAVAAASMVLAPSFNRGLVLVCPGASGLGESSSDVALAKMATTGANWVALNIPLTQDNASSEDIHSDPVLTPTVDALGHAVDEAHRQHLHVMLRPIVVAKDGTSRGDFLPPSAGKWMVSYTAALLPYLDVARTHHIDMVSLGSGYSRIESGAAWGDLIRHARAGFSGSLTYGAAHAPGAGGGGYQAVPFWATLDYVGIEAFFPVATSTGQTVQDFKHGWQNVATEIQTWARTGSSGKPILFTAVGLPALAGAGVQPGKIDMAAPVDTMVQVADCQAFFETFASQAWLTGAFWYAWEAQSVNSSRPANAYAVQDQPALATLQTAFGGPVGQR
jgi:hypothetical protein